MESEHLQRRFVFASAGHLGAPLTEFPDLVDRI